MLRNRSEFYYVVERTRDKVSGERMGTEPEEEEEEELASRGQRAGAQWSDRFACRGLH